MPSSAHAWTDRDTALWRTCEVAADLAEGIAPRPFQDVRSTFRPQLAADEQFWAAGAFVLSELRPGAAPGSQPRPGAPAQHWQRIDSGVIYLSILGFHLMTDRGVWAWTWQSMTSVEVPEPGVVHLLGQAGTGRTSWRLSSDWAELLFILWAFTCHQRHAQLQSGSWLPDGWLDWNATQQWQTRLVTPAISP